MGVFGFWGDKMLSAVSLLAVCNLILVEKEEGAAAVTRSKRIMAVPMSRLVHRHNKRAALQRTILKCAKGSMRFGTQRQHFVS